MATSASSLFDCCQRAQDRKPLLQEISLEELVAPLCLSSLSSTLHLNEDKEEPPHRAAKALRRRFETYQQLLLQEDEPQEQRQEMNTCTKRLIQQHVPKPSSSPHHRKLVRILHRAKEEPAPAAILLYFLAYPCRIRAAWMSCTSQKNKTCSPLDDRLNFIVKWIATDPKIGRWCRKALAQSSKHHVFVLQSAIDLLQASVDCSPPAARQKVEEILYHTALFRHRTSGFERPFRSLYRDFGNLLLRAEDDYLPIESIVILFKMLLFAVLTGKGRGHAMIFLRAHVNMPEHLGYRIALLRLKEVVAQEQSSIKNSKENIVHPLTRIIQLFSALLLDASSTKPTLRAMQRADLKSTTTTTPSPNAEKVDVLQPLLSANNGVTRTPPKHPAARSLLLGGTSPVSLTRSCNSKGETASSVQSQSTTDFSYSLECPLKTSHQSSICSGDSATTATDSVDDFNVTVFSTPQLNISPALLRQNEKIETEWFDAEDDCDYYIFGEDSATSFCSDAESSDEGCRASEPQDESENGRHAVSRGEMIEIRIDDPKTKARFRDLRMMAICDPPMSFHIYCHVLAYVEDKSVGDEALKRRLRKQLQAEYGADPLEKKNSSDVDRCMLELSEYANTDDCDEDQIALLLDTLVDSIPWIAVLVAFIFGMMNRWSHTQ